jgi:hypothetical protein
MQNIRTDINTTVIPIYKTGACGILKSILIQAEIEFGKIYEVIIIHTQPLKVHKNAVPHSSGIYPMAERRDSLSQVQRALHILCVQ